MKKKILLVDDEPQIVELVKMLLEANDYEVLTAYDGQEGLEKARKEKLDLIIIDSMLPKIDGLKVCALLKKDAQYSSIPIIIFSGRANESDMELGQEVGADAYITKSFNKQFLLEKIKELLKES